MAIQRVSLRQQRATDFRVVQGALNADGMGNLLSGILGTLPNTTYSSSVSLAEITGIGARSVGVVIGVFFFVLAFFPKVTAILIAIPGPVAGAYVTVLLGLLFVQGMKIVIQDGVDYRKAAVAGVSFWVGTGFQNQWIYPDLLGDGFLGVLLGNGMTSGAIVAIVMMVFMELTAPRRRRLQLPLDEEILPKLTEFLRTFASRSGWTAPATDRLLLVGEETITSMLAADGRGFGGRRQTQARGHRPKSGRRSGVGVRLGRRGGELGRPVGAYGGAGGCPGRARNLLPPAATLRIIGPPPEVPRRGHRDGACGEPPVGYHVATQLEARSDRRQKMEQPTVTGQTLMEAEFDDRYMPYTRWLVTLWLIVTVAGILVIPFWWLLSLWYCPEYMRRASARLTTNALEIRKGVFMRAEATIPLNRITDVRLHDGPPDASLQPAWPQGGDGWPRCRPRRQREQPHRGSGRRAVPGCHTSAEAAGPRR